jgi:hypothetical protein
LSQLGIRSHDRPQFIIFYRRINVGLDYFRVLHSTIHFLRTRGAWILRRISPHYSRVTLSQMPSWRDEQKLLWLMGYELAHVHLGNRGASVRIQVDLHRRKPKWLRQSAETMAEATLAEWKEWKRMAA